MSSSIWQKGDKAFIVTPKPDRVTKHILREVTLDEEWVPGAWRVKWKDHYEDGEPAEMEMVIDEKWLFKTQEYGIGRAVGCYLADLMQEYHEWTLRVKQHEEQPGSESCKQTAH